MNFSNTRNQLRFHRTRKERVMRPSALTSWFCLLFSFCLLLTAVSRADEGMWLFNNPPLKVLQEKYHFQPTPEWLDHVQKSSVRFDNGGSGSFVSANGLVMTNHHVGADCLGKSVRSLKIILPPALKRRLAPRNQSARTWN